MVLGKRILVVEDEEHIRKFIKINLEREGFIVKEAGTGEKGIDIVKTEKIDVVVLDIMLPGIDGFEVCKILRQEFPTMGIIMLTAKSQDIDKIMGLEFGTDDYMVKPFNPIELVLRVKSLLRRMDSPKEENQNIIVDAPFKIDKYSRKFHKQDEEVELTPTEYSIIKLFIENPGKAFSRDEILNIVWGYDFVGDSKIVDVNVRRLRSKIEDDPSNPYYIETIWGIGYRWRDK
ncbi:Alkaline phosphatase synthesis transcriptional regulatory protein PhoP [[Clostridium] ultunense Esp]|uniref:Alkaline phosphatase synthesis transcriptional regulatory protein PhoP n=1 Tax=[Clostridium] ultunense Esp TaxID=1288971 RepID=M1ZLV1_9FIRM|nr:response regulator transcription factor [Schnuerera ultunensis]CCQ97842.1 Alkaline phosphatase synthesis transcriptional regulatory protein PhoP [[Clostridium] ultunense Esp]SHD77640.1 Alkaline phosphatase synthesis transcriptional regulatory protein PhoP [[Clostridium] ultunense Esp]